MLNIEYYDFDYIDFLRKHKEIEDNLSEFRSIQRQIKEERNVATCKVSDPSAPAVQSSRKTYDDRLTNLSDKIDIYDRTLRYFQDKLDGYKRHFKNSLIKYKQIEAIVIMEYFECGEGLDMRKVCNLTHKSQATVQGIINNYLDENRNYEIPGLNRADYIRPSPREDYVWTYNPKKDES